MPELAPTTELLSAYKKNRGGWQAYETEFRELMKSRLIEATVSKDILSGACLLCSESKPDHCHRRLVAEYLRDHWHDVEIVHL